MTDNSPSTPRPPSRASEPNAFYGSYDPETESPVYAVVSAMAAILGETPTDLEPLYYAVDTDRLERFGTSAATTDDSRMAFSYYGYTVEISDDGDFVVRTPESETA